MKFGALFNERNHIGLNPVVISKKRGLSRNQKCPQWIFRLSDGYEVLKHGYESSRQRHSFHSFLSTTVDMGQFT